MMSKKRSFFGVFKEQVEEDCQPKLKKGGQKKKSFFSVFENEEEAGKKEDEKAEVFKFKKDPKESIKNHNQTHQKTIKNM